MSKKKYEDDYIRYGGLDIDVNRDYKKAENEYAEVGNFNKAGEMEGYRRNKIAAGYGSGYEPTYKYNYNPKYTSKTDSLREQLENFGDFDWNAKSDDAYKSLAGVYHQNAKRASDNALASAAAANGGRLGANAITAASLAYQDKMSGLEAEIPQLRAAAYNMYRDNKNDLRNLMYDYEAAEDVNYSRWNEDYDRRYKNTWDLINNNLKEREFAETILNGQAQRNSLAFADALSASQAVGHVTEELSGMTGIAPGTPTTELFGMVENMRYNLGGSLGKYPGWWLGSYGYGNEDNKTFEADSFDRKLEQDKNQFYAELDQNNRHFYDDLGYKYASNKYTSGNGYGGSGGTTYDYDYTDDSYEYDNSEDALSENASYLYEDIKQRISQGMKYTDVINELKKNVSEEEARIILEKLGYK